MVAREMLLRKGIEVTGFLDDDPGKTGGSDRGCNCAWTRRGPPKHRQSPRRDEVLVCISPKSRQSLHLSEVKTSKGVPVRSRIMPTLEEVLQTTSTISILPGVNEPPGSDGHVASTLSRNYQQQQGYEGGGELRGSAGKSCTSGQWQ